MPSPSFTIESTETTETTYYAVTSVANGAAEQAGDALPVLFQNDDFVVINKPHNLSVHSEQEAGLVVQLAHQLGREQIYPLHRLDKMTSGLMLFALNKATAQAFQVLFAEHRIEKYYLAISDRKPKKKQGWVKGDMLPARRGSWKLAKTQQNPAVTQFVSVSLEPGVRLYLLRPLSGKTHQIRVALKSLSAPICGDVRYAEQARALEEDRGYLHAYALRFKLYGQAYCFVCAPGAQQGVRFASPICQQRLAQWHEPWRAFDGK
jgi:tRNA pseudouridine32 synthase/23S rRNA pseudouridine746 synthase